MTNSSSIFLRKGTGGFTLVELLVVIAIIGILAGLMFPATTGAIRMAERRETEQTAQSLRSAIAAYFTEYRKYPAEPNRLETDDLRSDEELMDILLGAENERGIQFNPRRIAFYTGRQARPMGQGVYRKGITLEDDGGGALWDPWGEFYYVRMDLDYNNRVERPSWDESSSSQYIPDPVLVWSSGRSKEVDHEDDNIKTW